MRFMIHGADQKTGREMTIVVDAPDETEAERRALYNDILVSSIARFTAAAEPAPPVVPAISYEPVELPAGLRGASPPSAEAIVPRYREVLRGARWLGWMAALARWGGSLAVLSAIVVTLFVVVEPLRRHAPVPVRPVLWLTAAGVVAFMGLLCVLCGVMVATMSGLVVAVRDIAQNSFHIAAQPAGPAAGPQDVPARFTVGGPYDHPRFAASRVVAPRGFIEGTR